MLHLLSDEDFNGNVVVGVRRLWPEVDLVRVQEVNLSGHPDPEILAWAAVQNRCLLTNDKRTMIAFAENRVERGLAMPGLFVLRRKTPLYAAMEAIAMLALASDPADREGEIRWIPT